MTASIAFFGWMFLGLVTAVSLERPRCYDDDWWTSGNVLTGKNTPVFFLRYRKNPDHRDYNRGHFLYLQENAMVNLAQQSQWSGKSGVTGTDISNECLQSEVNPRTIYPKVVVVVDYKIYERYEKNLTNLLKYLMAVWTGVDLNLRSLNDPKIRLNIAGIVVADRDNGLGFINERLNGPGAMNINEAGRYFGSFIDKNADSWKIHFGRYHIAVLMTAEDTYWSEEELKVYQYSRRICEDIDTKGPPARIVFTDDGSWSRITRELTDAVAQSFHIGSPYAEHWDVVSSWDSRAEYTERKPIWAESRLNLLKRSLNAAVASCYNDKPVLSSPLPRVLPGKILDCDNQCKIGKGEKCCEAPVEEHCMNLACKNHVLGFIPAGCQNNGMYAADGTSCGKDGKVCYRRKCVVENEIR